MRVFLDTCTFQLIHDYGWFVFEGEQHEVDEEIKKQPNGYRNLEALHNIMQVQSAGAPSFAFVLSEASLNEVLARNHHSYAQYAYEVIDTWKITVVEQDDEVFLGVGPDWAAKLEAKQFAYLSEEDREILADSLRLESEIFLTAEEKLPKQSEHLERELPIRVLRPYEFWESGLAPHFRSMRPDLSK